MHTFLFGLPPKLVSEIENLLKNVWTEINSERLCNACRNILKYEFLFIALNFQAIITFWTWKKIDKFDIVWMEFWNGRIYVEAEDKSFQLFT